MQTELKRLPLAFLLSLILHALLLSLTFYGGQELGIPGLLLPWQQRWSEVANLNVVLQPTGETAAVLAAAPTDAPAPAASAPVVTAGPVATPSGPFAASLRLVREPVIPKAAARAEPKKAAARPSEPLRQKRFRQPVIPATQLLHRLCIRR